MARTAGIKSATMVDDVSVSTWITHRRFGGPVERTDYSSAHDSGFTLAELMAIVLIIGILVSVAVATYVPATRSAAAVACRHNQRVLRGAYMQAEDAEDAEEADGIDDLAPYVDNLDRIRLCPLDGATPLEFDAASGDISCPNHP